MNDNTFALFSSMFGLIIVNTLVLLFAHRNRIIWLKSQPIEISYVVVFTSVLLLVLNLNQWMPGEIVFSLLTITSLFVVGYASQEPSIFLRRELRLDFASLAVVQCLTLITIYFLFGMQTYWLTEGANHDSVVYYQGMSWAQKYRLLVGNEEVRAAQGLGGCGEGAGWIGVDCPLYRGGTYTILAWMQHFAPRNSANGLFFVLAYAGTIIWLAIRLLFVPKIILSLWSSRTGLVILATFSTGLVASITNSNLATALASSCLALTFSLGLRTDVSPKLRFSLMVAVSSMATHFYAESLFYSGLFIVSLFLLELKHNTKRGPINEVVVTIALSAAILITTGNIPVLQAISSLLFFSEIAQGGDWFAFYIDQWPGFWVGSFLAGLLMGTGIAQDLMILSTLVLPIAAAVLLSSRDTKNTTIALILLSMSAITFVETTGYRYGEHKIVHLLGPAWVVVCIAASLRLFSKIQSVESTDRRHLARSIVAVMLLMSVALINALFLSNAQKQIASLIKVHGVDFGLEALASHVRPGDTVVLDDSAWAHLEKFQKANFIIYQIHKQGARIVMSELDDDVFRGGYFRNGRNNTFRGASAPNWLVSGRGSQSGSSKFQPFNSNVTWQNADASLSSLDNAPLALPALGWQDCEVDFCWTESPFEIEVFTPELRPYEIQITFSAFHPQEGSVVVVRNESGQILSETSTSANKMEIKLQPGFQKLIFETNVDLQSPKDLSMSEDTRLLFLAVKNVNIRPTGAGGDK